MTRPEGSLGRDGRLLFLTRGLRMFAYGFLSVVLVLHLAALGFGQARIGLLLSLTLAGDTLISLGLTTRADRWGRRATLAGGALLMAGAGAAFAFSGDFWVLLAAATLGVLSPSGNEVGPFLAVEQASLSQILPGARRTAVFAWYNLAGSFCTALGALGGGWTAQLLQAGGASPVASYRVLILAYAAAGLLLAVLFRRLSPAVEVPPGQAPAGGLGLGRSRGTVFRLSALFSLDAFAGGFVIQSLVAWWFHTRFGVNPGLLGTLFFGANVLAGISALLASRIADRIGLLNTMVFTHIPSNVLLILVPLMPTLPLAAAVLLLRFSISQMDVPTRQSYTMAVVEPGERSAAAGVTGIARTTGAALSPALAGPLMAGGLAFVVAGSLKIVYDLLLWRAFRHHGGEAPINRP
ncbi:MAG TPA: MFS transporter [Holophaga sp.]|nr:MFS transporter [Holophaga sp.]